MKKHRTVQVFLKGSEFAEISGFLVKEQFVNGIYTVVYTEDIHKEKYTYRIPYRNLGMVRLSEGH